ILEDFLEEFDKENCNMYFYKGRKFIRNQNKVTEFQQRQIKYQISNTVCFDFITKIIFSFF
ncbi:hypothetical protein, partial [Staphylococcus aureus]|uniref:hypothetical protein n=1 Tax=Staphylococcus aureus TaxID=1280 RepID=UPI001E413AEE